MCISQRPCTHTCIYTGTCAHVSCCTKRCSINAGLRSSQSRTQVGTGVCSCPSQFAHARTKTHIHGMVKHVQSSLRHHACMHEGLRETRHGHVQSSSHRPTHACMTDVLEDQSELIRSFSRPLICEIEHVCCLCQRAWIW